MTTNAIIKRIAVSIILLAGFAFGAMAHDAKVGPNGGPLADLDELHLELVMKADEIKLFVSDVRHEPVNISQASANLIILAGTNKHSVKLSPIDESILGQAFTISDPGPYTVVAIVTFPGKKPLQARFTLPKLLALLENIPHQKG